MLSYIWEKLSVVYPGGNFVIGAQRNGIFLYRITCSGILPVLLGFCPLHLHPSSGHATPPSSQTVTNSSQTRRAAKPCSETINFKHFFTFHTVQQQRYTIPLLLLDVISFQCMEERCDTFKHSWED